MKTSTRRAVVVVAAGALGLGGLALAAPAVAGAEGVLTSPAGASAGPGWGEGDCPGMGTNGPGTNGPRTNGPGTNGPGRNSHGMNGPGMDGSGAKRGGHGHGMGPGMGAEGMGAEARDGGCPAGANLPEKGTLTEEQKSTLAGMAEEEKLAHDLYTAFAAKYDAVVFDRIASSESQHLTAVRTLLDRYRLADPTSGEAAGRFSDPTVQATYDRLLAQGQANEAAALQVGQTVEQTDIDDLRAAQEGLTAADVRQVYEHLLAASQHHLTAFQR